MMKIKDWFLRNCLVISLLFIASGFVIMSIDESGTNGGKSFHQLTIAPILLLLGYSLIIFVIMNPQKNGNIKS